MINGEKHFRSTRKATHLSIHSFSIFLFFSCSKGLHPIDIFGMKKYSFMSRLWIYSILHIFMRTNDYFMLCNLHLGFYIIHVSIVSTVLQHRCANRWCHFKNSFNLILHTCMIVCQVGFSFSKSLFIYSGMHGKSTHLLSSN